MAQAASSTGITVQPLTGALGAVVGGVRLSGDMTDEEVLAVRRALLRHRVVFLHDQQHLDDDEQKRFAARLGPITAASPVAKGLGGADHTAAIDSRHLRANAWHTDATFLDHPPAISVLRAITLPAIGGDTLWANTVAAYRELGPTLQKMIDGLRVRHSNAFDYAVHGEGGDDGYYQSNTYAASVSTSTFEAEHPLVRIHPETGERALLLGYLASGIIGLKSKDSKVIIDLLQRHIERPDNIVRWQWSPGDVAIWDNRSTQHYAVSDYDEYRLMRRVTVAGEIPSGIDGRPSRALMGDHTTFSPVFVPPPIDLELVSA